MFVALSLPLQLPGFLPPSREDSGAVTNKVISASLTRKPSLRRFEWLFPLLGEPCAPLISQRCGVVGRSKSDHCTVQRFQHGSGRAAALLRRGGLSTFPGNLQLMLICANHLLAFLCCGKLFSVSPRCSLPHYSGSVYVTLETKINS